MMPAHLHARVLSAHAELSILVVTLPPLQESLYAVKESCQAVPQQIDVQRAGLTRIEDVNGLVCCCRAWSMREGDFYESTTLVSASTVYNRRVLTVVGSVGRLEDWRFMPEIACRLQGAPYVVPQWIDARRVGVCCG